MYLKLILMLGVPVVLMDGLTNHASFTSYGFDKFSVKQALFEPL